MELDNERGLMIFRLLQVAIFGDWYKETIAEIRLHESQLYTTMQRWGSAFEHDSLILPCCGASQCARSVAVPHIRFLLD